jgi:hypothetical protein
LVKEIGIVLRLLLVVSSRSVALPLGYLRRLGAAPMPTRVCPAGPLEELLADYRRYLSVERGLCDHTVLDAYGPAARLFFMTVTSSPTEHTSDQR